MRAAEGWMHAQTGGIKASIGEQSKRIMAVERVLTDHKKDTDNKFISLEKKVDRSEKK